jgi:uncharacterized protein (DUF3820 family)
MMTNAQAALIAAASTVSQYRTDAREVPDLAEKYLNWLEAKEEPEALAEFKVDYESE